MIAALSSRQARERPADPGDDCRDESEEQHAAQRELATAVGDPPQEVPAPGPTERPNLEGEAALLDLRQRRQDHGADERQDPAQPGPDAALRVEAAGTLGAGDDGGPLDHR